MTSLIWKDIMSQIKYLGLLMVFYTIFSLGMNVPAEVFIGVGIVMTAFRLGYLEDKNNTLLLLRTMPVKPVTIVFSKFFSILLIAVSFLLINVGYLLIRNGWDLERIVSALATVTVMLLFAGVFFALFFKLGYQKASTYIRIFSLLIFVFFMVPFFLQRIIGVLKLIGSHIPLTWVTATVLEVGLLGIYLLLGVLATAFYKSREELI